LIITVVMNERYKELIKYQTEIQRVLFVIFFADATGMISLIKKGYPTAYEWILFLTGLFINLGILIVGLTLDRKIRSEINKLQ
jgi:hypothetical protein